jgi:hypothetical protein
MKSKIINLSFIVMCFLLSGLINNTLNGQDISKEELEKRAMENFNAGKYGMAVGDFQSLHNLFPKDPRISYYLGRSYLQSNQKLDEACELLKLAAIHNYGEDSYFYLGLAYQLTYRFEDAEMAYTTFKKTASNRLLKTFNIDYWIEADRNAKELSVVAAKIDVIQKSDIPVNVPESAFKDKINGKYIYVPDELRSKEDIALNFQTLMYICDNIKQGDYLYYAGHSKNTKQGLDIFRVKRLTLNDFSQPEALSAKINSPYDEEYPYYDAVTGTLYFSSKGHTTSGGYDIFSTQYDSVTKDWKTPERLAFPINTPFDDFLYTITKDNSGAIFLSNRNAGSKDLIAVRYNLKSPAEYISPANRDEILQLAAVTSTNSESGGPIPEKNIALVAKKDVQAGVPNAVTVQTADSKNLSYNEILTQALGFQAKTDSINSAIKEMQKKTETETDYLKKQEIIANIVTLNNESKRLQKLANDKFNEAEQLHASNEGTAIPENKKVIKPELAVSGQTINTVQENKELVNQKENQVESKEYSKGLEAATVATDELNKNFQILSTSPYSKNNPIPPRVELSSGLVYRIQLAAYAAKVSDDAFRGLSPISCESVQGKNVTRYFVGYFSGITEARKALESVKKYGYPDAFLVSYYNKEKITIEKAREIEFAEK